jgi:hypothetical protein
MRAAVASKYEPLTRHLRAQNGDSVKMKFSEIERIIGAKLPPSADRNRAYWSNNAANSVLTRAWLDAGFRSEQVDLVGRRLVFRRVGSEAAQSREAAKEKMSMFGCMAGTVVVHGDLTEPADPELADFLTQAYGPFA